MKKLFEKPGIEMISIVSEAITGDIPGMQGGNSSGITPDD